MRTYENIMKLMPNLYYFTTLKMLQRTLEKDSRTILSIQQSLSITFGWKIPLGSIAWTTGPHIRLDLQPCLLACQTCFNLFLIELNNFKLWEFNFSHSISSFCWKSEVLTALGLCSHWGWTMLPLQMQLGSPGCHGPHGPHFSNPVVRHTSLFVRTGFLSMWPMPLNRDLKISGYM